MHKKDYDALKTGKKAFDAWQRGEFTGDYSGFEAMIADNFELIAHPMIGRHGGQEACQMLRELIAAKKEARNSLMFSSITSFVTGKRVGFQFDVKGTLRAGARAYSSHHIMVLEVDDLRDVITGFSEYFGTLDAAWLESTTSPSRH
jgi:ketosteroid isomerase-like protein